MANLVFTNMGRLFIKQNNCSGYTYLGTADLAGISTSFGESTYIYLPSEINVNEYDIVEEIKSENTNTWSSSLTMYLDMDSHSLLLDLAKRRCSFSLQVHYGSCINPTDFADFETGFLLENVTITDYSTGQLTARSPDAKGIIDESVSITATNVHQLFTASFYQSEPYSSILPTNMGMFAVDSSPNITCKESLSAGCGDGCNIALLGSTAGSSSYAVQKIDNVWYEKQLDVGAYTDSNDPGTVVYNGNKAIYLLDLDNFGSPTLALYELTNSQMQDETYNPIPNDELSGNSYTFSRKTYASNSELFIAAKYEFGAANYASPFKVHLGTGKITYLELPDRDNKSMLGVDGISNHVFFFGTGYLIYYNNNTNSYINLSGSLPVANKDIIWVNIVSRKQFYINVKTSTNTYKTYCTNNGGFTWTAIGSVPEEFTRYTWQNSEIGYAIGASGQLYETFDGGVNWNENNTIFNLDITDVSVCQDNITISQTNSSKNDSLIAEN